MIVDQKNFFAGLFYIVVGAAFAIAASRYQMGTSVRMGPGYFPFGVAIALAITGMIVLGSSLSKSAASSTLGVWSLRNVIIVLVAVVLFGVLLEPMGLIVAVPVLIGIASLANPEFSWREALLSIAFLLPLTWVIFILLLGLQFRMLPFFLQP